MVILFIFFSNCHTILHNSCTILHSLPWCTKVTISPHLHQRLLFHVLFCLNNNHSSGCEMVSYHSYICFQQNFHSVATNEQELTKTEVMTFSFCFPTLTFRFADINFYSQNSRDLQDYKLGSRFHVVSNKLCQWRLNTVDMCRFDFKGILL